MGNKTSQNSVNNSKSTSSKKSKQQPSQSLTTVAEANNSVEPLDVKVYRSTSTIDEVTRRNHGDKIPDIRLYRRSCAAVLEHRSPAHNTQTLPRGFGRHSVTSQQEVGVAAQRKPMSEFYSDKGATNWNKSNSTRGSMSSLVQQVDFPSVEMVKCRLLRFEQIFVRQFTKLYFNLPATIQLSALSIAVHRNSMTSDHSPLSLWQYLHSITSGSVDLEQSLAMEEFALTITRDQLTQLQQVVNDGGDVLPVAQNIVTAIATDAAQELSRVYEYQLVLLGDGAASQLVPEHAANIAIDYLKSSSRHLDCNTILQGIVLGSSSQREQLDVRTTLSVIVGHFELKWNVSDIFRCPGLRRERLLLSSDVETVGGYSTPWTFHVSADSNATIYGYRGQVVLRDYLSDNVALTVTGFCLDQAEERLFVTDVRWRPEDFHQLYRPYRRLVGAQVMSSYAALVGNHCSLAEYVQRLHRDTNLPGEIQPVYRPIASPVPRYSTIPPALSCSSSSTPPGVSLFQRTDQHRWSVPYYHSTPVSTSTLPCFSANSRRVTSSVPPPVRPKPVINSSLISSPITPQLTPLTMTSPALESTPVVTSADCSDRSPIPFPTVEELFSRPSVTSSLPVTSAPPPVTSQINETAWFPSITELFSAELKQVAQSNNNNNNTRPLGLVDCNINNNPQQQTTDSVLQHLATDDVTAERCEVTYDNGTRPKTMLVSDI